MYNPSYDPKIEFIQFTGNRSKWHSISNVQDCLLEAGANSIFVNLLEAPISSASVGA
jgi:hypothetical protein